jgi:hypothetical protein
VPSCARRATSAVSPRRAASYSAAASSPSDCPAPIVPAGRNRGPLATPTRATKAVERAGPRCAPARPLL